MPYNCATKAHQYAGIVFSNFPWISICQPVIGTLYLASILNLLAEEAITVSHTVTKTSHSLMGHGIKETSGKSTQSTIAKTRVYLLSSKLLKRCTHLFKALCNNIGDTKIE